MNDSLRRLFPATVVLLATCFLMLAMRPDQRAGASPYDLRRVASLPVTADGRVKPLDTIARVSLLVLSGRQSFNVGGYKKDAEGKRVVDPATGKDAYEVTEKNQPAVRWLLDVFARPEQAREYRVFRIDHPDVLAIFGKTTEDGTRYDFDLLLSKKDDFLKQVEQAQRAQPKSRNPYQKAVVELYNHLMLYNQLSQLERPFLIPPTDTGQEWMPFSQAYADFEKTGEAHPAAATLSRLLQAYRENKPEDFNRELDVFEGVFAKALPDDLRKSGYEVFFNNWEPFYQATILYVVAFLLACVALLIHGSRGPGAPRSPWGTAFTSAAAWLLVLTFLVHTAGLASRIYLQGRPPVTNLYSSAVFIGWACVFLSLFLERIHRLGLGSIAAAAIGFVTMVIAHNLGGSGDTMEMMQAVLDSNFWLSTHVVTVTLGYSATFLAGFLGILYIGLGVFTRVLTPEVAKAFVKMVYGVVAFALLLSFIGTVLGGIWADQSWGRFWGWDPKENGAVLIVLMNALILHARWDGMIRDRGLMTLAVTGNIITSWSWFGTNMLGVGLHSYGFMDSAVFWLLVFVGSQLLVIGVGLLPDRFWRSKQPPAASAKS